MGKVLYSVSMSLDGYITGAGGEMSWLIPYLGPNPEVDALAGKIGALLVGNRTFRGDDPHQGTEHEGKAFDGAWEGPQFVLTHHPPAAPVPGITFVGDLASGLVAARAVAGERYVNILGADVARQCLAAGELDEVFVSIAPVLLGDGVRLFAHPGGKSVHLERIGLSDTPLATTSGSASCGERERPSPPLPIRGEGIEALVDFGRLGRAGGPLPGTPAMFQARTPPLLGWGEGVAAKGGGGEGQRPTPPPRS